MLCSQRYLTFVERAASTEYEKDMVSANDLTIQNYILHVLNTTKNGVSQKKLPIKKNFLKTELQKKLHT